jgi:putative aldouronate transport system permease protein
MIIPLLLIIVISFSSEQSIIANGYQFIPETFSLDAYELVFNSPIVLLRAYGVTVLITVAGTALSLLLTTMTAYVLARRDFLFVKQATFYVFFTMLFNGGLVPFYILMTQYLHLRDNLLALIIPALLSPFNILIMRAFLQKIPFEMIESAKIDGARETRVFFTMVLPLSTPALATLGLIISFNYWNEWFNGLLFIEDQKLVPLQLLLVRMLSSLEFLATNTEFVSRLGINMSNLPRFSVRMATAVLAAGPMLLVFPFFQRYFVSGLTVGSLKG